MANLIHDEPTNENVRRHFAAFHAYMDAARDVLMSGRGLRGRARKRVQAAIGHALAFSTWRSLARDQGLDDPDAVELTLALVAAAGERQPSQPLLDYVAALRLVALLSDADVLTLAADQLVLALAADQLVLARAAVHDVLARAALQRSLPAPPQIVSLPAPPLIESLPPRPAITSGSEAPRSCSLIALPRIPASFPLHETACSHRGE